MTWPGDVDYNEAVQNPDGCFEDGELRRGRPALNPQGLPKVWTGNFACVYQIDCPGPASWAVRCFRRERELAERRARYQAIGARLRKAKLPFTVEFGFL